VAEYLNAKLPQRVIAITKECDRTLSIRRRDPVSGVPVDWGVDVEVYIKIDIDSSAPTRVSGVVDGSLATIRMESTILDTVRKGTTWRVIMSQPGVPRHESAVMVGIFERNDGK
jgi:hypothetical protein